MTLDKQGDGGSPIRLRLDPSSGVPTYLQVVQQVERALRLGFLQPGDQLPKVREVVAELAILRRSLRRWLDDAAAAGLDDGGVVALVEITLREFPERATEADATGRRRGTGGGAA